MKSFTFHNAHTYTGDKAVILVSLIRPGGVEIGIEMVIDSGAEISLLSRNLVRSLRLIVEDGRPIELVVANGDIARAYIHPVEISIAGRRLAIEAAICPDWDTKNFLGMRGFFDQMVVAFDHANRTIHF